MRRSRPQLPPRPRSPSSAIPPPSEPVPYSPSRNPPSTLETSTSGIPPRRTSFRPIPETILPPTRLPRRSLGKEGTEEEMKMEKELPDVDPEIGFLIDIWTRTSDPTTFRVKLVIFNEETSTFDVYLEDPENPQDPNNYILKIDNTGRKYFSNTKTPYYFSKFQIPFSLSPPRSISQLPPKSLRSTPQPQSQRQPLPKYPPESETFQRPPFRLSPESPPKYQ